MGQTVAEQVYARIAWRLIPFMMLLYVVSFIDRTNIGFAALTMNRDLGFSPSVFGFGAGLFFVTYNLCQVPAALMLERFGARRVVTSIMVIWGLLAAANAFVQGRQGFYALRLLLGVAEAGFFPGMMYYLTLWFPPGHRGRYSALFAAGIPMAGIVGGPLSGLILGMDGAGRLHGWQWLFLLEGLPAVLLAFAVHSRLPDGPAQAAWLDDAGRRVVAAGLAPAVAATPGRGWRQALGDVRVWILGFTGFCNGSCVYGIALWLPQMIQAMGFGPRATGFLSALPYLAAMAGMVYWGRSSDRRGDRIRHIALAYLLVAASFCAASLARDHVLALAALSAGVMGVYASFGPYFTLPSTFLGGAAAAGGIALVNSVSSVSGFLAPFAIGLARERTGGYAASLATLAAMEAFAAVVILLLRRRFATRPG